MRIINDFVIVHERKKWYIKNYYRGEDVIIGRAKTLGKALEKACKRAGNEPEEISINETFIWANCSRFRIYYDRNRRECQLNGDAYNFTYNVFDNGPWYIEIQYIWGRRAVEGWSSKTVDEAVDKMIKGIEGEINGK